MKATEASLRRAGITIVLLHVLITVVHSMAHSALYIYMSNWQNAYILIVIVVLPVVAALLLWRRRKGAYLILFVSMLGSLLFGGYYHFVAPGPDNVAFLTDHTWTLPFQISAALLAVTEAAGTIVGLLGFSRTQ